LVDIKIIFSNIKNVPNKKSQNNHSGRKNEWKDSKNNRCRIVMKKKLRLSHKPKGIFKKFT